MCCFIAHPQSVENLKSSDPSCLRFLAPFLRFFNGVGAIVVAAGLFFLSYGASSLLSVDSPPARPGFYNGSIDGHLRFLAEGPEKSLMSSRME